MGNDENTGTKEPVNPFSRGIETGHRPTDINRNGHASDRGDVNPQADTVRNPFKTPSSEAHHAQHVNSTGTNGSNVVNPFQSANGSKHVTVGSGTKVQSNGTDSSHRQATTEPTNPFKTASPQKRRPASHKASSTVNPFVSALSSINPFKSGQKPKRKAVPAHKKTAEFDSDFLDVNLDSSWTHASRDMENATRMDDATEQWSGEASDASFLDDEFDQVMVDNDRQWIMSHKKAMYLTVGPMTVLLVAALVCAMIFGGPKAAQVISSSIGGIQFGLPSKNKITPQTESSWLSSVNVPVYYSVPHDNTNNGNITKANEAAENSIGITTSNIPSTRIDPDVTDDLSKAYNSDGGMNDNFSYLTVENISHQVADDIQRLVNPTYGNWQKLAAKGGVAKSRGNDVVSPFKDMLTDDYKASIPSTNDAATALSAFPLFADYDMGKDIYSQGNLWNVIVGVPGSINCDTNIQGSDDDTITCNTTVTYYGSIKVKSVDGGDGLPKKVKTEKNLSVTWKVDYSGGSHRILVDSVSQS